MGIPKYDVPGLDLAMACRRSLEGGSDFGEVRALGLALECLAADNVGPGRKLEDEVQAALVATLMADPLEWQPGRAGVVAVHHSPLGYYRSGASSELARRAGARAGWADLDVRVAGPGGPPLSLLIELKVGKGRPSKAQRETQERMRDAGFDYDVFWGLVDPLKFILYQIRQRGAAAPVRF